MFVKEMVFAFKRTVEFHSILPSQSHSGQYCSDGSVQFAHGGLMWQSQFSTSERLITPLQLSLLQTSPSSHPKIMIYPLSFFERFFRYEAALPS